MHFKLIIALVDDEKTTKVIKAARKAGATGATIINHARGEGLTKGATFLGLGMETQRDVILFLVEEHFSRAVLETVSEKGRFDNERGSGIAFSIDVDDAVGVAHQIQELSDSVEDEI
jgi:nitrogen regulatory protein PII